MERILRVNMERRTVSFEPVPADYRERAGRWLTSSIVHDEVPPTCHPLGPANKVVFSPGVVTGTSAPTSSRISVGGKSPLTGGIKEANAGTGWARRLARLGLRALIVEGQPSDGSWWLLRVDAHGAAFERAEAWSGRRLSDMFRDLYGRFGGPKRVDICAIGAAGEQRLAAAGVCFSDQDGRASRYAGRGGLGAVMGSKGLKGIVLDDSESSDVTIADPVTFDAGRKKLAAALAEHAITKPKGALNTYGTAVLVNILNEAGGLPTRNFREGRFEGAAKIAGEAIFAGNQERTGAEVYNHACSPGCVIRCSNTWHRPDGTDHTSCIEYESDWAFGANCGVDDLDVIAELNLLCNEYGLDTIEIGDTLAVAMEAGVARFGEGARAIELVHEIGKGTPLGRILGNGAAFTGRAFGVVRVPQVKGQGMPAYEPRTIKGIGMTYAVSTMGADHTSGYTIAPEILGVSGKLDPLDPHKTDLARNFQYATAFLDSTGHCLFIAFAILDIGSGFEGVIEECSGVLGASWTMDDVGRIGKAVLDLELDFNRRAGFTAADDRLPEFMAREPLPPHGGVWDVPDVELDRVFAP
ncbi:MAG: aldehyde ferredoxin oxidoreductase C-terminal domain-containing protein [Candidatus Bipolaricaulota bacterium]